MSALAEHPTTASTAIWSNVVISDSDDHLEIDEPVEFDVLVPVLLATPEEPEPDYPDGAGPHGC